MHRARTIVLFSLASACLMSLFLSDALHAQGRSVPSTGVIRGRILDSVSGEGTKGAHVRVAGTTVGAIAGTDGTWLVRNVPAGDRTIGPDHGLGSSTLASSTLRIRACISPKWARE